MSVMSLHDLSFSAMFLSDLLAFMLFMKVIATTVNSWFFQDSGPPCPLGSVGMPDTILRASQRLGCHGPLRGRLALCHGRGNRAGRRLLCLREQSHCF